jgi:hypothetical protein
MVLLVAPVVPVASAVLVVIHLVAALVVLAVTQAMVASQVPVVMLLTDRLRMAVTAGPAARAVPVGRAAALPMSMARAGTAVMPRLVALVVLAAIR